MSIELSIVMVIIGALLGAAVSYLLMDRRHLEQRLKALEERRRPAQASWTHSQLDQIERLKFLLGRHVKEREIADEFLKSIYHELGRFYSDGPDK